MEIKIQFRDPAVDLPPLNRDILAVVESCIDRGRGFKAHYDLRVLRILCEDIDGDEDEGSAIHGELESGDLNWQDAQLRLMAGIDDIDDFWSNSIIWWADMPQIEPPGEGDAA